MTAKISPEQRQEAADALRLTAGEVDRLIASLDHASRQLGEAIRILAEEASAK